VRIIKEEKASEGNLKIAQDVHVKTFEVNRHSSKSAVKSNQLNVQSPCRQILSPLPPPVCDLKDMTTSPIIFSCPIVSIQNYCDNRSCPPCHRCQTGFTWKGYRCVASNETTADAENKTGNLKFFEIMNI